MMMQNTVLRGAGGGDLVTYLNGVDAYITLPITPQGATDLILNIEFLIPSTVTTGGGRPIFWLDAGGQQRVAGTFPNSNLFSQLAGNITSYNSTVLARDVWHELEITYDGVNKTSQLDGGTITSVAETRDINTSNDWYLGRQQSGSNYLKYYIRFLTIGTNSEPNLALFNSPDWINKGSGGGSDGIITNAIAVPDPTL